MLVNNFFIIIAGPTAVGKSDFALKIAKSIPSEIVNIDLGQFYAPLNIGTAKPNLKAYDVEHHMFNIIDKPKYFSVVEYRTKLLKVLKRIQLKNKIPILVGGSNFYIKSLFFPPQPIAINNKLLEYKGNLWEQLYTIDPNRASQINRNDTYRIKRALNIWFNSGKKPSDCKPEFQPISTNFIFLFLTRNREELYSIINKRTKKMIENGWIEEVKNLSPDWKNFLIHKKLIGYMDILLYLNKEINLLEMIEKIQQKTRNYARKQEIFRKKLLKELKKAVKSVDIKTLNLTDTNADLYIKQLLNYVGEKLCLEKKREMIQ